jgi:hypothetical protein
MTTQLIDLAQAEQAAQEADSASLALLAGAESFTITSVDQYQASGNKLTEIKARQKELNELRLSLTRPLDQSKNRIVALFKPSVDRLTKAEGIIKGAMINFTREQERKRQEAEAKLRAAGERERERLERLAEEQRERGKEKLAEKTDARAAAVPTLTVTTAEPQVAGVSSRKTYRAEVEDLLALVRAVANGEQPLGFLDANYDELNRLARQDKEAFAVPGVKLLTDDIVVARAAR